MTAFEELFQMTTKLGLSTISRPAPHRKWRISVSRPDGAKLTGARASAIVEMSLCEIDADTPEQAAVLAVEKLKDRFQTLPVREEKTQKGETI